MIGGFGVFAHSLTVTATTATPTASAPTALLARSIAILALTALFRVIIGFGVLTRFYRCFAVGGSAIVIASATTTAAARCCG